MKILVKNRRARYDYAIEKTYVAGVALMGSEVKAIRMGRVELRDAHVEVRSGEAWLINAHVGEYPYARHYAHEAKRDRKLLLNKAEIERLGRRVREKGFTIIPLDVHLTDRGLIKLTIGLAKGKGHADRRQDLKKRDMEREIRKHM